MHENAGHGKFVHERGINSCNRGIDEVHSVGVEVIWVAVPGSHREGDVVLNGRRLAPGEMEVLLEVGRFQCGQRCEDYYD
jgi:hypothetical protein